MGGTGAGRPPAGLGRSSGREPWTPFRAPRLHAGAMLFCADTTSAKASSPAATSTRTIRIRSGSSDFAATRKPCRHSGSHRDDLQLRHRPRGRRPRRVRVAGASRRAPSVGVRRIPVDARAGVRAGFIEGIEFSRGLSDPDEPTICVRDLTGRLRAWIEIGNPDAARLHKAAKAAPRVAVYTHKDPEQLVGRLAGERIHRAEAIELWAMDRSLIAQLAARLDRRMSFAMSVTDRELYVSIGSETLTGAPRQVSSHLDDRRVPAGGDRGGGARPARRRHSDRLGARASTAASSAADTTGACSAAAPCCTARWTRSKTPAASRHGLSRIRALHDAVAVRDVQRRDPALRHPDGRHRREPDVPGRRGAAALAGRRRSTCFRTRRASS